MSKLGTFYSILTAQNPYSSGSRGLVYSWCSNYQEEECTRSEFLKRAKRACQRLAERSFYDTLKDGGTVKVFTDREKFTEEYKKLTGASPRFID